MVRRSSSRLALVAAVSCYSLMSLLQPLHAQNFTTNVVIQTGDYPTLTFRQDNSMGFTPIDWIIGGGDPDFTIYSGNNMGGHAAVTIKPLAPLNSLFISEVGHIGMGTNAVSNDNLTIRSDVTSCSIHLKTAQEAKRFQTYLSSIGDVSYNLSDASFNHSTPMTMQFGTPDNSLFMASTGNIGLGTSSPVATLHALTPGASTNEALARFQVSDDSFGRLEFNNATTSAGNLIPRIQGIVKSTNAGLIMEGVISTDTGSNPVIVYNGAKSAGGAIATRPLVVYRNNGTAKVTVAANGNVTATSFITASSRELKDQITDLDSAKASAALRQLNPVEFVYKDDASLEPRVGFIAEDVPELVAEPERKSVPVMDVVAILTRVVKDQDRQLDEQRKQLSAQESLLKELQAELASIRQASK